jgi:hypothetical protein
MRLLAEYFPEFSKKFDEIDELYKEKRTIDEKTYQFICFALSIKNRSVPCIKSLGSRSHSKRTCLYYGFNFQRERWWG